jgi:hypothetical protein
MDRADAVDQVVAVLHEHPRAVVFAAVHAAVRAFRIFIEFVRQRRRVSSFLWHELRRRTIGCASGLGMTGACQREATTGEREFKQIASFHDFSCVSLINL